VVLLYRGRACMHVVVSGGSLLELALIKLRLHLDDSTCTDRSVSPIDFSLIRADLERVTERSRSVLGASCKVSSKLVLLDAT
jgi:hypothetical protein